MASWPWPWRLNSSNSDWFTGLFVLFVIGYDDYYGFSSTFYLGFGFGSRHTQSIELYVTA